MLGQILVSSTSKAPFQEVLTGCWVDHPLRDPRALFLEGYLHKEGAMRERMPDITFPCLVRFLVVRKSGRNVVAYIAGGGNPFGSCCDGHGHKGTI